jgi:hypothetical protein
MNKDVNVLAPWLPPSVCHITCGQKQGQEALDPESQDSQATVKAPLSSVIHRRRQAGFLLHAPAELCYHCSPRAECETTCLPAAP